MASKIQRASSTATRGTAKGKSSVAGRTTASRTTASRTAAGRTTASRTTASRAGASRAGASRSRTAPGSVSRSEAGRRGAAARWGYSLESENMGSSSRPRSRVQSPYTNQTRASSRSTATRSRSTAQQGYGRSERSNQGWGNDERINRDYGSQERDYGYGYGNGNRTERSNRGYDLDDANQGRERSYGRTGRDYEEDRGYFVSNFEDREGFGRRNRFSPENDAAMRDNRIPRNENRNSRNNNRGGNRGGNRYGR